MLRIPARHRLPITVALLVLLIVGGTIVAKARGPAPEAGATYTGTIAVQSPSGAVRERIPVSFAVNAADTRVGDVRFPAGLPAACRGDDLGSVAATPGLAPIRSPSHFRLALAIRRTATANASAPQIGTLTISGAFHTFGREDGAVATSYSAAGLRRCGTGAGYVAKAISNG